MSYSRIPKYLKTPVLFSFLITMLLVLTTLVFFFRVQPQIPIFYSLARTSQHLASKHWLFLFPSISLIINLLHLLIIRLSRSTNKLLLQLFAGTTMVMQLLLGLALLRILIIIT